MIPKLKLLGFILLGVIAGWTAALLIRISPSKGFAEIFNKSDQEILQIDVIICRSEFQFRNLPPGSNAGFSFTISGQSGYKIQIEFASGQTLHSQIGYVTPGFNFSDRLIVTSEGVRLETGSVTQTSNQTDSKQPKGSVPNGANFRHPDPGTTCPR